METEERLRGALSDRYTIEAAIDSGGMATVYRARDLKHDRTVAIKVLRPDLAHDRPVAVEHLQAGHGAPQGLPADGGLLEVEWVETWGFQSCHIPR